MFLKSTTSHTEFAGLCNIKLELNVDVTYMYVLLLVL